MANYSEDYANSHNTERKIKENILITFFLIISYQSFTKFRKIKIHKNKHLLTKINLSISWLEKLYVLKKLFLSKF